MKKVHYLLLLVVSVLLCACGSEPATPYDMVEYFPFQSSKDGRWGLISPDGKVLFDDEFERRPTVAINGRFMVENADGLWEIYTAEEKPRIVGTAYKEATLFYEDVAPVVEKGKCVTLIDRDGKEVKALDKLDGKTVESVSSFWKGIAFFKTSEGYYGAIDTKGNVVLRPVFCTISRSLDGHIIAIDKKYESMANSESGREKVKFAIFNANGKLISELPDAKYASIEGSFADGVMPVSVKRNDKEIYGLIDDKGEWVLPPSERIKDIGEIRDGKFIYSDGEFYGVMDLKGEVLIRAKYDRLYFAAGDRLFARDGEDGYILLDLDGKQIGTHRFLQAMPFVQGGHAPVELADNYWGLIDKEGQIAKKLKTDIYEIETPDGNSWVNSDYVDLDSAVEAMKLSANGLYGFTFSQTARDIVALLAARPDTPYQDRAADYTYSSDLEFNATLAGANAQMHIGFPGYIAREVTEPYNNGYFTYQRTVGHEYNEIQPTALGIEMEATGRLEGKADALFRKLSSRLEKLGATVEKNASGHIVRFSNGNFGVVGMEGTTVLVIITTNDLSNVHLNDIVSSGSGNTSATETDSAVVEEYLADSTLVDSVAA